MELKNCIYAPSICCGCFGHYKAKISNTLCPFKMVRVGGNRLNNIYYTMIINYAYHYNNITGRNSSKKIYTDGDNIYVKYNDGARYIATILKHMTVSDIIHKMRDISENENDEYDRAMVGCPPKIIVNNIHFVKNNSRVSVDMTHIIKSIVIDESDVNIIDTVFLHENFTRKFDDIDFENDICRIEYFKNFNKETIDFKMKDVHDRNIEFFEDIFSLQ
jgi:hypothetical protein